MKKVVSVLIALTLVFAIAIPVFAGANVDALGDAQQKEIATLVLNSINAGNATDSILGRTNIVNDVVNGITNYSTYKSAYDADSASINVTVSLAVTAVQGDVDSLTTRNAAMLTTAISSAIVNKIAPETTTQAGSETESTTTSQSVTYIVDLLSNLSYSQIESMLVSFVGNKVITSDEAKVVANALYGRGTITADQRDALIKAVTSDEASTNAVDNFFKDYTTSDLAQLFRGFGDSILQMSSALSNLFRSNSSGGSSSTTTPNGSGTSASDIPETGDYAIPAVATIAVAAGLALVLTKKKKDD